MPRNGSDVYSLPATYPATTGELIEAQQHNDPLEDLEQDMNTARPVVAGGTGASTAVGGHDAFSTKGANVASAGTCDIGAASGMYVHITGTTTITAFGTKTAGVKRILVFDGILTLTHNATSLILPTGANITTAAGDVAHMVSEGSGNWKCVAYVRANGTALALPTSPTLVTPNITGSIAQTETNDTASGVVDTALHDSASPAASDIIWQKYLRGKDSAGNTESYALTRVGITDPTSTSEDGFWDVLTVIAGTLARRILVGAGFVVGSPTGGDPGAGKINATEYQANGTALPFHKAFESTQQTITAAGSLTLAHGLGSRPKLYLPYLQCTTAEQGYSIGDEVAINPNGNMDNASDKGVSLVPDATNINVRYGSNSSVINIIRKDTGASAQITAASWRLVVRAWA